MGSVGGSSRNGKGAWNGGKKFLQPDQPDSLYFFEHLLPFLLNQNILNGIELTALPTLFCPLPQSSKHVPFKMYFKVTTKLSTGAMGIIGGRELTGPPNMPSVTPVAIVRAIERWSLGFGEVMVGFSVFLTEYTSVLMNMNLWCTAKLLLAHMKMCHIYQQSSLASRSCSPLSPTLTFAKRCKVSSPLGIWRGFPLSRLHVLSFSAARVAKNSGTLWVLFLKQTNKNAIMAWALQQCHINSRSAFSFLCLNWYLSRRAGRELGCDVWLFLLSPFRTELSKFIVFLPNPLP